MKSTMSRRTGQILLIGVASFISITHCMVFSLFGDGDEAFTENFTVIRK